MNTNTHAVSFELLSDNCNSKLFFNKFNIKLLECGGELIDTQLSGNKCTAIFKMSEFEFSDFLFYISTMNNCRVIM